jgi:hypothetical protein
MEKQGYLNTNVYGTPTNRLKIVANIKHSSSAFGS